MLDFLKNSSTIYSETSLIALYLLCLGTEAYVSVLIFLLRGYIDLAEDSYQKNELENCNQYFSLGLITAKDFVLFLNGRNDGDDGLINKVISVLNRVKHLDYIKRQKYEFTNSVIKTPFLGWRTERKVSYAIQYRNNNIYSQVGDWSNLYTLSEKACPELEIGTAPQNTIRFIFRKFDSDKPELVGIVKDNTQRKFKDIDRDLYNLALEENEEATQKYIENLPDKGANPQSYFEKGR